MPAGRTQAKCISLLICSVLLSLWCAVADAQIRFDLPAQPLAQALTAVGSLANLNIYFDAPTVDGIQAPALKAELTAEVALERLLAGTQLRAVRVDENTIRVVADGELKRAGGKREAPTGAARPSYNSLRVADARGADAVPAESTASGEVSFSANAPEASKPLDEVIVTAQKRAERLLDVPASVSAVTGDRLESLQVSSLSDLASYVPGMTISSYGSPGQRTVVLRGLNDNYVSDTAGPVVGTYIDDLPVNTSTSNERGGLFGLDLMPYDIERIEVLEGPQGTLYGGNTLGGLIKYALRKPNLTQFDARVGADVQYVNASGEPDRGVRAAVNLPLVSGQLGVRLSGFFQDTAGYINNVGTGAHNANHANQGGGRIAVLWQPTDSLSVELSAIGQHIDADDQTIVTLNGATLKPLYGPQTSATFFPEPFKQETRNYSLAINWDVGFATLTSATGWSSLSTRLAEDFTIPYGQFVPDDPNALTLYDVYDHVHKFVEEVRLTSHPGRRLQWIVGGFYTEERGGEKNSWPAFTSAYVELPPSDNLFIEDTSSDYKELAGFGDLTYQIADNLDITGGARYSQYRQSSCPGTYYGLFGVNASGAPSVNPCTSLPNTGVTTWMGDIRYHLAPDTMTYVRVASGYRPGQGCPSCGIPALGIPGVVKPDRTTNYELGFKGELLDHSLQVDSSIYYIDWRDIQLNALTPDGLAYFINGGRASSQGVELNVAYRILRGLHLNATVAYTDAHLTADTPPGVGGMRGDQLPVAARWTGSLTADYTRPLTSQWSFLLGGGYRYRDRVVSQFPGVAGPAANPAAPIQPQNIVDFYTGAALSQLTLRLYGKNIFNNRSYAGLMFMNDPTQPKFVPVLPRTIGLSVDYHF